MAILLTPENPVTEEILLQIGPQYIGTLMTYLLFGVLIMQLYHYSLYYHDHIAIKLTVYGVFLLDGFQAIVVAAQAWYAVCSGWGRLSALLNLNWGFSAMPAVTASISAWVQGFYAWRIYVLSQSRVLPIVILSVSAMQFVAAYSMTIMSVKFQYISQLHSFDHIIIVWLGGAAVADIIIAVSMLYFLFGVRRNRHPRTQLMIERLIRSTIETGVVTATCAITELILFLLLPTTDLHVFFANMLGKIYSNALLTSLNARQSIGAGADEASNVSSPLYFVSPSSTHTTGRRGVTHSRRYPPPLSTFTMIEGEIPENSTIVHMSTLPDRETEYSRHDLKPNGLFESGHEEVYPTRISPLPSHESV